MCGIAGIADVTGRPVDRALLQAMTNVQAHRGPDGEAVLCRGAVGLGHRRLAIIDLSTGDQPMSSDDGRVWIIFNGEIYNFRELRQELEAAGARFRTQSDTEVILRAYEAEGPACVNRLRGMFAFAILDERTRRLGLSLPPFESFRLRRFSSCPWTAELLRSPATGASASRQTRGSPRANGSSGLGPSFRT